jgi:hypothetical protein
MMSSALRSLQFNIAATGLKIVVAGQHGCKAN